ncbi:MAG TPA: glycosyltransferase [Terriglobales bacterium]|jgi:glycosyltransferase involved in cell wall biosynthesis|nr:glycosyltransferase [Terriglobales bacterium]
MLDNLAVRAVVSTQPEPHKLRLLENDLVSVVILNYNYGHFLKECIDSVLAQDYQPIELIVVDDGSTDDSRSVIDSYSDRLHASFKSNGGMVTSMNHGFNLCKGSIVIFLDADDYLLAGAVAAHARALRKPGVVRSETYMTVLNGTTPSGERIPGKPADVGEMRDLMLRRGPGSYVSTPNSGNAWSRNFLDRVFPLPETRRTIGSETFLMDAAPLFGEVVVLDEVKAAYRLHGANMTCGWVPMTVGNIRMVLGHYETRMKRLAEISNSLGLDGRASRWRNSNWRILTLEYLAYQLSSTGAAPGFIAHLKSTFKVRHPLKRIVMALVILGIRILPQKLSVALANRVINLRYM